MLAIAKVPKFKCRNCNGFGRVAYSRASTALVNCLHCNGTGIKQKPEPIPMNPELEKALADMIKEGELCK